MPVQQQRFHPQAKMLDLFSICACHPCAGAMLIFSATAGRPPAAAGRDDAAWLPLKPEKPQHFSFIRSFKQRTTHKQHPTSKQPALPTPSHAQKRDPHLAHTDPCSFFANSPRIFRRIRDLCRPLSPSIGVNMGRKDYTADPKPTKGRKDEVRPGRRRLASLACCCCCRGAARFPARAPANPGLPVPQPRPGWDDKSI